MNSLHKAIEIGLHSIELLRNINNGELLRNINNREIKKMKTSETEGKLGTILIEKSEVTFAIDHNLLKGYLKEFGRKKMLEAIGILTRRVFDTSFEVAESKTTQDNRPENEERPNNRAVYD